MHRIVPISGHCPEIGTEYTIDVEFAEVRAIGMQGYKAISYSCEYAEDGACSVCGPSGVDCPLFRAASLTA